MSEHQTASGKRFVLWAVLLSALLMAALTARVYFYARQKPSIAAEAARDAAFAADYGQMRNSLEELKAIG